MRFVSLTSTLAGLKMIVFNLCFQVLITSLINLLLWNVRV